MATKRINATRMELLRLRRRAVLAKKGHKLLKDKLDGLVQNILKIVKSYGQLRSNLDKELTSIFQQLIIASGLTSPEILEAAAHSTSAKAGVDINIKNIMGVKIPKYELKVAGEPFSYGFYNTSAELDQALQRFKDIMNELVVLAEYNKAILVIASHIIEIKRRVNALEYILIPELDGAIKFIRMKLAEMERSTTVSLLKIKDIVRAR